MKHEDRTYYVYVLDKKGKPLMPTRRFGHVRRLLKTKKAVVVDTKPFTIRLKYDPDTNIIQELVLCMDPGRTNIGLSVVRKDGTELFSAVCHTRNKEVPKLMTERAAHRRASRRGERLARKRLAKKLGTATKFLLGRMLPGYDHPVMLKDIINTEARFHNRKRKAGWLTPTATQLLRTHVNLVKRIRKILPVTDIVLELNRFAFMALDNPGIKRWEYQKGPLYQKGSVEQAVYEQQNGVCLLCGKHEIEEYHHMTPRSKGGSETVANRAGLCRNCHELVHKSIDAATKLQTKKSGLNKRYGALSVLNQIIPFLTKELEKMFPDHTFVTEGKSTKGFRMQYGIEKDHDLDAYCIACSILEHQDRICFGNRYEIRQFRRHDRAKVKAQTERTYKLDGQTVARNRRKRMDQKEDSLHEWFLKTKKQYGLETTKKLQSELAVQKSIRRYNRTDRLMPGAVFIRNGKRYVMSGQRTNGKYLLAVGDARTNHPEKLCSVQRINSGLVFL